MTQGVCDHPELDRIRAFKGLFELTDNTAIRLITLRIVAQNNPF